MLVHYIIHIILLNKLNCVIRSVECSIPSTIHIEWEKKLPNKYTHTHTHMYRNQLNSSDLQASTSEFKTQTATHINQYRTWNNQKYNNYNQPTPFVIWVLRSYNDRNMHKKLHLIMKSNEIEWNWTCKPNESLAYFIQLHSNKTPKSALTLL